MWFLTCKLLYTLQNVCCIAVQTVESNKCTKCYTSDDPTCLVPPTPPARFTLHPPDLVIIPRKPTTFPCPVCTLTHHVVTPLSLNTAGLLWSGLYPKTFTLNGTECNAMKWGEHVIPEHFRDLVSIGVWSGQKCCLVPREQFRTLEQAAAGQNASKLQAS